MIRVSCFLFALLTTDAALADNNTSLDSWLNDDSEARAYAVNEGNPVFLESPIDISTLHSENFFTINEESLDSGWVSLKQCYRNLDSVNKVDVVYQYKQMRDLRVLSHDGVDKVRVVEKSVQLEGVSHKASLCVQADVRVFYTNTDNSFSLINGPYFRRFLDGYYPYYVTFEVNYPGDLIVLKDTLPQQQEGFDVVITDNKLNISAWFEGALMTEIRFINK